MLGLRASRRISLRAPPPAPRVQCKAAPRQPHIIQRTASHSLSSPHPNTMPTSTLLGIRLHDLQGGLLSRELRLQVVFLPQTSGSHISKRHFRSSRQRRGWPVLAAIIGGLKSSTALSVLGTVVRVSMTFIPAIIIKNKFISKYISKIDKFDQFFPGDWQGKRETLVKHLAWNKIAFRVLLTLPMLLLVLTMVASVERAPLTGRWRIILISANEEEEIIKSLTGSWRTAVNTVLASTLESGVPPPALPPTDWRHRWVEDTLRRLEAAVPLLQLQQENGDVLKMMDAKKYPFPPPCAYPLAPRPRPARVLHSWAEQAHPPDEPLPEVAPQALIGPPYSCLVVERPDSQNAFSYGFGPNGAGGVVVYTGFLDEVLNHPRTAQPPEPTPMPSFWSTIFGSLVSSPRRRQQAFVPTEEQTAELAVLLAHELAHLLLSHHLETLSSGTILYPSVLSIFTDVARTILFPITMLLGPFVNDALGQLGRNHSAEFGRLGEMCSARKLEIEADIVSARLLAFSGFDPREAVKFWENRVDADPHGPSGGSVECAVTGKTQEGASWAMGGEVHPLNEERIRRLKAELEKWGTSWRKLLLAYPLASEIDEFESLFKT